MLVTLIEVDQTPQQIEISDYVDYHTQWDMMCDYIEARYVGWFWLPKDRVMIFDEEATFKDLKVNIEASRIVKRKVWGPTIIITRNFLRQRSNF